MCSPSFLFVVNPLLSHSDEVFGTGVDPVNLASALKECSWEKTTVLPGLFNTDGTRAEGDPKEVATGVIEVSIDIPLDGSARGTVRNAVTTAVQNKLGHSLPGPYDYVLYSLQGCYGTDCGWAAYAYINSWNSVYQGVYYKRPGVLVHEVSMFIVVFLQKSCNIGDSLLTSFYSTFKPQSV